MSKLAGTDSAVTAESARKSLEGKVVNIFVFG
jgi:hypothetical protein